MAASARLHVLRVFCASDGSGGNPLGVFADGDQVPDDRRQAIAADLGFSETVFVDDLDRAELRILTPAVELPLAGHPLVGTAWLLRDLGRAPEVLRPLAGEVTVRFEDELVAVVGDPRWAPPFQFVQVDTAAEVDALEGPPSGFGLVGVWAWADEARGTIRERVFVPEAGVDEDEATGSAAMVLVDQLARPIEISQGRGSVIRARPVGADRVEIAGRVVLDEVRDYPLG
jgi:predicted PhzF superfamily epimerase YddE/YHI9